jgi:hypothetical protein
MVSACGWLWKGAGWLASVPSSPDAYRKPAGGAGIAGRAEDFEGRLAGIIERPDLPAPLARLAPILPNQELGAAAGVPVRRFLALALGLRPEPRLPKRGL